jgi:hypothetical protein
MTSSVIDNNDTITTNFDSVPGVCNTLDAVDEEWPAPRDPLPLFGKPFGLLPGVRMPMPVCCSAYMYHKDMVMKERQLTICSPPSTSALHALDLSSDQCPHLSGVSRNYKQWATGLAIV